MSRLDVVVFGASGYTGRYAVEQLVGIAGQRGLTWGIAGRSREKLLRVLKDVSDKTGKDVTSTEVLIADVDDDQALQAMCARARVLVNCCGPYTLYGEPVVRAAVDSRTHYVDVSGEPNFIELMHLKYGQAARDAGVFVVSACGFESIPVDLGVLFLQQNFGGVLNSVECYLSGKGSTHSVNFGTWHSMVNSLVHFMETPKITKKTYPKPLPPFTPKLKSRLPIHKRGDGWCLPFPTYDVTAVYRTQRYFYDKDNTRPAQFKNYVKFDSIFHVIAILFAIAIIFVMSQFKFTRKILLEKANIFSLGLITNGPSEKVIKNTGFEYSLYGLGWDESDKSDIIAVPPRKSVIATVSGLNPGYGMTVAALLYSAVVILQEPDKMPPGGGVMSPGAAFARTSLLSNLQDSGVSFKIVHNKLHRD